MFNAILSKAGMHIADAKKVVFFLNWMSAAGKYDATDKR